MYNYNILIQQSYFEFNYILEKHKMTKEKNKIDKVVIEKLSVSNSYRVQIGENILWLDKKTLELLKNAINVFV